MGLLDMLGIGQQQQQGAPQSIAAPRQGIGSILGIDGYSPTFQAGLQMLSNSMPSTQPTNLFQNVPEAIGNAQVLQQRRQAAEQDAIDRQQADAAKAALSAALKEQLPANLHSLADANPEQALALWKSMKPTEADAFTLGTGETRYAADGSVIAQGAPDTGDAFGNEKDLFAQYNAAAPVKQYQDVRNGFERVRTSAAADSGVGDLGVVYGFMKMLDPGSVVREGEFATAENTSGVPEQVLGLYNRLISGERLTPQQRAQFVQSAEQLYGETASNLTDLNSQFSTRAGAWGVDPSRFVVAPETYEPFASQSGNEPRTTSTGVNWSY